MLLGIWSACLNMEGASCHDVLSKRGKGKDDGVDHSDSVK